MQRYRLAALLAAVVVSGGAVEAQKEAHGRQDGRPQQAQQQQRAKPQERGPKQSAQKGKPQERGAQSAQAKPQERGQGQKPQRAESPRQGKGQSAERAQGQGQRAQPQQGRSQDARVSRGNAASGSGSVRRVSRPVRLDRLPDRLRPLGESRNHGQRVAAVALARGLEHNNALPVNYVIAGDRVRLLNRRDELLLDLSDDEARRLGSWDVRRLDARRVRGDAPAFCRSGAGHPVWGREWCMDKGFGLGSSRGLIWGRHQPDDLLFLRDDRFSLDRGGILDVLGAIAFNRLALHALTLGLADPLAGRWIGEPAGPRVMLIDSGDVQVAELVDLNRDGRVDVMYVVSR